MNILNLDKNELEKHVNNYKVPFKFKYKNEFENNKVNIIGIIIIYIFLYIALSMIGLNEKIYLIIFIILTLTTEYLFFKVAYKNKYIKYKNDIINEYITKNYDISISEDINIFDVKKLLKRKFFDKNNDSDFGNNSVYTFKDESINFNVSSTLYVIPIGKRSSKLYILSKIKFEKNINIEALLDENKTNGIIINIVQLLKYIINSIIFGTILYLLIFNNVVKSKLLIYLSNLLHLAYIKSYLDYKIILIISVIVGIMIYIVNYTTYKMKQTKINDIKIGKKFNLIHYNGYEFKEGYIENLYNFIKNDFKYGFYINDNELYIKAKNFNFFYNENLPLIDFLMEMKNHIQLAHNMKKYYN